MVPSLVVRGIFLLVVTNFMTQRYFVQSFPFGHFTTFHRTQKSSLFHTTTVCYLNRFLFDATEVSSETKSILLSKDDYRTIHAAKILGLRNGDTIRAGVVRDPNDLHQNHLAGFQTDAAIIEWIPEGKVKKAEILKNGDPPGSLLIKLDHLLDETTVDVVDPGAPMTTINMENEEEISVSLILALPRPLQLGRMLPMISQMGVNQLVLTGARKVPRDYFGSHLFRKPEVLRERLIEGLCQAGDVRLPKVHTVNNLKEFFQNDLDRLFPLDEYARVLAHPQRSNQVVEPMRMSEIIFPQTERGRLPKMVIAVGPEGGWEEPEELDHFETLGFQQITLGKRTLRSDCAVVSLLSLAHEVCHAKKSIPPS